MIKSFNFHYNFAATFETSYYLSLNLKVSNRGNMYQREGEGTQAQYNPHHPLWVLNAKILKN
jgi:hypothetical protein